MSNINFESRENWADYVKAIAIFSMVLCHANVGAQKPGLLVFIYTFHMPIFFLISGYFDRIKHGQSIKDTVKKLVRTLLIPYLVFNIFAFTYCWYGRLNHPELNNDITASQILPHGLLGIILCQSNQTDYSYLPNGPLWFLIALFECKMIYMLAVITYRKSKIIACMLLVSFFCLLSLMVTNRYQMFSIGSALLALPFYCLGGVIKKMDAIRYFNKNTSIVIFIVTFLILYTFAPQNGRVDMSSLKYGNYLTLFYINALIGSIMCISLAKCLGEIHYLSYIGKNTLVILCLHKFFMVIGIRVVSAMSFIPKESFTYCMLISLFSIIFCIFFSPYIMKRWPYILGK